MNGAHPLAPSDFAEFYREVYGYAPHNWQQRLVESVLANGRWPSLLDLPTGVGKTSALDIAVFTLAANPHRFARRVVFVVDRRLIVDQVGQRVGALVERLRDATDSNSVVGRVANSLRAVGGPDQPIIGSSTLRGGIADATWAQRPDKPWIMVSTVDQVGSRLLFRGYGTSPRMRPIHAGLVGSDCLILLDEVHVSRPFAQTLRTIADHYRSPAEERPWQVVEMSATPGATDGETFGLDARAHTVSPMVAKILEARKPTTLHVVGAKSAETAPALASAVPARVASLFEAGADSCGVIVNRVASAVACAEALTEAGFQPLLLTGRMRPFDRAELLSDGRFARVSAGSVNTDVDADDRVILVSTQSIEVGADLDFGAMITECAPMDSLKQRFGRVDRRGSRSALGKPAQIEVLAPASIVEAKRPQFDPVYGDAYLATWNHLEASAGFGEPFDAGIASELWNDPPDITLSPSNDAPLLLPSHLDRLCQTNPAPAHDLAPAPWLHGVRDERADVNIVWRAALPDMIDSKVITSVLNVQPPRPGEMLSVPLPAAARWLARAVSQVAVADIDGSQDDDGVEPDALEVLAYRFTAQVSFRLERIGDLKPGDTIIVGTDAGGMKLKSWSPESDSVVLDIADLVVAADRAAVDDNDVSIVRCLPANLGYDVPRPKPVEADAGVDARQRLTEWLTTAERRANDADRAQSSSAYRDRHVALLRKALDDGASIEVFGVEPEGLYYVLIPENATRDTSTFFDGSDELSSFTGRKIRLDDHLRGVGEWAALFAARCGLADQVVEDFRLAGLLHDLGKLDPRFQLWLHDGDRLERAGAPEPIAKSGKPWGRTTTFPIAPADRYPRGGRHELLSVSLVHEYPDLAVSAHDLDLVLHLVATHHGYCRPFAPPHLDPTPVRITGSAIGHDFDTDSTVRDEVVDARTADRFWMLNERLGRFRLAWYETLFRLADHHRSQLESLGIEGEGATT